MSGYRTSHAAAGYGAHYDSLFRRGYFDDLWTLIERPLLLATLEDLASGGATTCLDFACGTGRITQVCAETFVDCWGVDISNDMLAIARAKVPAADFRLADLTRDRIDLPAVDVITAFRFFLNAEQDLRDQACDALHDSLQSGGHLILNIQWNSSSPAGMLFRARNRLRGTDNPRTASARQMRSLLEEHGFIIDECVYYGLLPWLGFDIPRLTRAAMKAAERLLRWFKPLQPLAQNYLLVAHRQ